MKVNYNVYLMFLALIIALIAVGAYAQNSSFEETVYGGGILLFLYTFVFFPLSQLKPQKVIE